MEHTHMPLLAKGIYEPLNGSKNNPLSYTREKILHTRSQGAPPPDSLEAWEFPGWGNITKLDISAVPDNDEDTSSKSHTLLGEWRATAICGNDITSSCFYVVGSCTAAAGILSPVALIIVALMLYLFRAVYGEVGTALPVNGGAYNVLLNSTSKGTASLAACLTLLSYVATGVVSGTEACHYLLSLWDHLPDMDTYVQIATVGVLFFFAALTLWGIGESSDVALGMFVLHMLTMVALIVASIVAAIKDNGAILSDNYHAGFPTIMSGKHIVAAGSAATALFYGTSAAMLGISGFETSANFIEEQKDGVFVKTLRNMWACVSVLNPTLAVLCLALVRMDDIEAHSDTTLALMAEKAGGSVLKTIVSVDAAIVLSGAVLTAYVGVTGLARRMSMDRCLPAFLLRTNKWRGTNHFIIVGFGLIASSLYLILGGNVKSLSGVYTVAFLSVMSLFGFGCMLLKWKRPALPRAVTSSWGRAFIAVGLVITGLIGNILSDPTMVQYFVLYFSCTLLLVALMFFRTFLLKVLLSASRKLLRRTTHCHTRISRFVTTQVKKINEEACVFYLKHDDLPLINKAVRYVRENEETGRLLLVHVYDDENPVPIKLKRHAMLIDRIYPKLRVDLVLVRGSFGPKLIQRLSKLLNIPQNMMFVACPDSQFQHKLSTLGGVRVITQPSRPITQPQPEIETIINGAIDSPVSDATRALTASNVEPELDLGVGVNDPKTDVKSSELSRRQSHQAQDTVNMEENAGSATTTESAHTHSGTDTHDSSEGLLAHQR